MQHDQYVALELYFPDGGYDPPNDFKILGRRGNVFSVLDPNGDHYKIVGDLVVGNIIVGGIQSSYGGWRSPDPDCRLATSYLIGHPENPRLVPICFRMRVHALHKVNDWQHPNRRHLKRTSSAAAGELQKRKRH